jgi:hypothetical protein
MPYKSAMQPAYRQAGDDVTKKTKNEQIKINRKTNPCYWLKSNRIIFRLRNQSVQDRPEQVLSSVCYFCVQAVLCKE